MAKQSSRSDQSGKSAAPAQATEALTAKLKAAEEKEKRALADYQNLVRRTQEDRLRLVQLANRDLVEALLQPLEHLELAVAQQDDAGLRMVLEQFQSTLREFGVEEISAAGQEFDVETMEAAEGSTAGGKVSKVLRKGYRLNGQVIQHAKVILE